MSKRTIILLSIFIALFILAGVLFFVYRNYSSSLLAGFFNDGGRCVNISDEGQCYQHDYCEGIYDKESKFKYCQEVSDKVLAMNAKDQELCNETGGKWYRNKFGNFCLCQNSHKFDQDKGCSIE